MAVDLRNNTIEINGKTIVFGLDWLALGGLQSEKKEIIESAKSKSANRYVKAFGSSGESLIGFLPDASDSKTKVLHSGSLIFSNLPEISDLSILLHRFDNGQAIFCASKSRAPVVGYDFIGDYEIALELAKEYIQLMSDSVSVYGNSPDLFNIVAEIKLDVFASMASKENQLIKVGKVEINAFPLVLIAIFVAFSWYVYDQYFKISNQPANTEQPAIPPTVLYQDSIKKLNASSGIPARVQWQALHQVIHQIPMQIAGWDLKSIDCVIAPQSNCVMQWTTTQSTFNDFEEAWEIKPAHYTYDYNKDIIISSFNLAIEGENIILENSPNRGDILLKTGSQLQLYKSVGLDGKISSGRVYGLPQGVTESTPTLDQSLLIYKDEWELQGKYWMTDFIPMLNNHFTIQSLKLTVNNGDINFTMKGINYVKK